MVAGASTHPGKFGFVALHNILANGYAGRVFATNLEATPVLGVDTVRSIADLPDGGADLVFVCTPAATNIDLLRACAAKGIKAAFLASAGYAEAGEAGAAAQAELVAVAEELGVLIVGPNGQGVISTPSSLCAQIVAPYPPPGAIGIASQSGNFVSSFMNYARHYGVGISRAVSAGNAAAVGVVDYLDFYADDPATKVGLAYVEGLADGRAFIDRMRSVVERMPVVLVKGGASAAGARAAASHTGSLASDDRVFDGAAAQAGPHPRRDHRGGLRRGRHLRHPAHPDAGHGSRWSPRPAAGAWWRPTPSTSSVASSCSPCPTTCGRRSTPSCRRGGAATTPSTSPAARPATPSRRCSRSWRRTPRSTPWCFLGMGIQANQGRMEREGPFYPEHGLDRIVDFHERQDRRYTTAAAELSRSLGKPILTASELAVADRDNPAVVGCRESGVLCYASANRAVRALGHAYRHARWRQARGLL